jgi:Plasmid pRiA4b ORF-3-like protein
MSRIAVLRAFNPGYIIMMMRQEVFTKDHEQHLRDQVISDTEPGPVLRDFRMLLDFIGRDGIESGGKYNLLPLKFIGELNARLSQPLNLALKRPQLRSHPYLEGLNLLLRASGLVIVERANTKAKLVVDPSMRVQWNALNPVEQYFNLLEAWLRIGRGEMVGEGRRYQDPLLSQCLSVWRNLPREGSRFEDTKPDHVYISGSGGELYHVALMDLFGLLSVDHPRTSTGTWKPAGVAHTPFGDAALTLIASRVNVFSDDLLPLEEKEDARAETPKPACFGAWQTLFQPYFPEWRQNLELPEIEPREGTFIFRVSLGKICWRLIAMPADATLDDLVSIVLHSVNFDNDHLYQFSYRGRLGATCMINHPAVEEGPWTYQISIGSLPLEPGQSMELLYDFGDEWPFTVRLERVDPPGGKAKAPRIIEKHGESPVQYEQSDAW